MKLVVNYFLLTYRKLILVMLFGSLEVVVGYVRQIVPIVEVVGIIYRQFRLHFTSSFIDNFLKTKK